MQVRIVDLPAQRARVPARVAAVALASLLATTAPEARAATPPPTSFAVAAAGSVTNTVATTADPFLWLESVDSPRAMKWVNNENAKTLAVLQNDPGFAPAYAQALEIGEAKDRIPAPVFLAGAVYNFWQDATHVRGIWRRTTLVDYTKTEPAW